MPFAKSFLSWLWIASAIAVTGLHTGCIFWYDPRPYKDLVNRPPREVTEITLKQTDEAAIDNGVSALLETVQAGSAERRNVARSGIVALHEKMRSGWPGFRGRSRVVGGITRASTAADLAGDMYDEIEIRVSSAGRNESLLSLLRELKPHDDLSLLARWERAMNVCERGGER